MPSILLVVKHAELERHNAEQMVRIARETAMSDTPISSAPGATAGGDWLKLRGIPVVGGVGGVIAGTSPHLDGPRNVDNQMAA